MRKFRVCLESLVAGTMFQTYNKNFYPSHMFLPLHLKSNSKFNEITPVKQKAVYLDCRTRKLMQGLVFLIRKV